ncbi:MAG: hypothetical protein COV67_05625 [Nitrospinae bacterium CG11_big_fil_rev_8_21_14_0_20_56_8]|nr:MAG: hypothetical protein COV67_05625 [Nitrospinae bacterium CG11_big_fil_rev_8_21_14_0_20_56_8]
MAPQIPTTETIAKIMLDEANLAFCETAERKDQKGNRTPEGSAWDEGKMEGEYDQEDYRRILDFQVEVARICDAHPELEERTAKMFESVTEDNAEAILKEIQNDPNILTLGINAARIFMLRFPTVQSFVNKGHPLVLAADEYMLENADAQNWHDYEHISRQFR